jgi:hypothetical protein
MFAFKGVSEDTEKLARQIRRLLQDRHAMHIGEMRIRLGVTEDVLHGQIEEMMACGEIERLRPMDYPWDDHDFFRLNIPITTVVWSDDRYSSQSTKDGQWNMQPAREAMACLLD